MIDFHALNGDLGKEANPLLDWLTIDVSPILDWHLTESICIWGSSGERKNALGYISKSGLHKFVGISFVLVSTCYSYIAYSHLIWLKIGVVDIEISMGKWSLENNFSTDAFFRWLNTKHNSRGVAKCDIAM